MNKIKISEIFGGIGAFTHAAKNVFTPEAIEITTYVELDKYAVMSYNAINNENFKPTDVNDVDFKTMEEVDIMIAGWPCQDYSFAGLRKGLEGTRSSLILLTIDKIREMENKPKYILLENVKGLLSKKHTNDLTLIKELFAELGYQWSQATLNSKNFNNAQGRERVYMVLTRNDLKKVEIESLEDVKNEPIKLKNVLDLSLPYEEKSLFEMMEINKGNIVEINGELNWRHNSDRTTRRLFRVKGDNKTINFPHTRNYTNNVVATLEGQMPTIMAGSTRYVYLGEENDLYKYRQLSSLEAWMLMGFSEEAYYKVKNLTIKTNKGDEKRAVGERQMTKQAGNSIVVNVLEAIINKIFKGDK